MKRAHRVARKIAQVLQWEAFFGESAPTRRALRFPEFTHRLNSERALIGTASMPPQRLLPTDLAKRLLFDGVPFS